MKKILLLILFILLVQTSTYAQAGDPSPSIRFGTTLPATCSPAGANVFFKTDTGVLYNCTAANTWTSVGSAASKAVSNNFIPRSDGSSFINSNARDDGTTFLVGNIFSNSQSLAANTSSDGVTIVNPVAATVGNQSFSPRLRLTGQGWKTDATAASQTVDWIVENQPVQGAANPSSLLSFSSQVNGGGYTQRTSIASDGTLALYGAALDLASGFSNITKIQANGIDGIFFSVFNGVNNFQFRLDQLILHNDMTLRRNATANLALGAADAASPVAQTLSVQNVVGGTSNTAGAVTTIIGSLGTSTGVPGRIELQTGALTSASGSTQQTAVPRQILGASKTLSNNTTTTVANITDASDTSAAVIVSYAVEVNDGASHHQQVEVGQVSCSVVNTNGVFAGNTCVKYGNQQSISASGGTLTVTWTITGANPALLQINSNTATITPSMIRVTYNLQNLTQQAVAIQ